MTRHSSSEPELQQLFFEITSPDGHTATRELEGDEMAIGRSSDCEIVFTDRHMSRRHARAFRSEDRWMIEDLGSRNGTIVNGVRISEPTTFGVGDELKISGYILLVRDARDELSNSAAASSEVGSETIFKPAGDLVSLHSRPSDRLVEDQDPSTSADALRGYADRLRLLNEIHGALSRPIELPDLLDLILKRTFDYLSPEEAVLYLKGEDGVYWQVASQTAPGVESVGTVPRALVREVAEKGNAALVVDAPTDERFIESKSLMATGVRSLVAAPLMDDEGSLGMVVLSSRAHKRSFSQLDMELLASLASIAALRIRNLALIDEAARRRHELEQARRIQESLIPADLPRPGGYQIFGSNVPSRGVSGDFYRVAEREVGTEILILVADVSGKGLQASLLTAFLEALIEASAATGAGPSGICEHVGSLLYRRTPPSKYATAVIACLEPDTGVVKYANAGQNPPVLQRADGGVEMLGSTGAPIGLFADSTYDTGQVELEPGDLLAIYTDGITEAENPADEEFGLERLQGFLSAARKQPLEDIAADLETSLIDFVGSDEFVDDRTLVLVRRDPAS